MSCNGIPWLRIQHSIHSMVNRITHTSTKCTGEPSFAIICVEPNAMLRAMLRGLQCVITKCVFHRMCYGIFWVF